MLQIRHVCKEYRTGKLVQKALDDFSLNLRDNEFVAILGPSGSGKTTLLNIIGGLDRYDSGEMIINGISTKMYKDRDWDSYRNHTIGFVFQNYNLIPHQTLLSNVELALTISGVGKRERRQRALNALEKVGLGDQVNKKPSQLSGGQMQRVAIARALVNDPDILLADEPTGALDTVTSIQVMDLLKEVAKDRLVVMVTHNPELADKYATRIVKVQDGRMISDSDPYIVDYNFLSNSAYKNMGKAFMRLPTAISLSFNNLLTKKARTILTAFAGSIGIIGIALILSLSTGVNVYIAEIEEETLSGYPLEISSSGFDFTSLLSSSSRIGGGGGDRSDDQIDIFSVISSMFSTVEANDLGALKEYLESGESGMEPYINAIEYEYDASPQIYLEYDDGSYRQVNPDSSFSSLGFGSGASASSMISSFMSTDVFYELPESEDLYIDEYELRAGRWPENYNEVVLVLSSSGGISDFMLYSMGLRDAQELDDMIQDFVDGKDIETPEDIGTYTFDDVLGITFKLVNASDYYEYDETYEIWKDKTDNTQYMKELVANGEDLTIVGIVQPKAGAAILMLSSGLYYEPSLIEHIAGNAAESEIVQAQLAEPSVNVFTGEPFGTENDENDFDITSMFTIDEEALTEVFSFDSDALEETISASMDLSDLTGSFYIDTSSLNLSGMLDFSGLSFDTTDIPEPDLSGIADSITFDASSLDMSSLADTLVNGYLSYSSGSTGTDYANMGEYFSEYLSSPDAQAIIAEGLTNLYTDTATVTVDMNQIDSLASQLASGYMDYISSTGGSLTQDYMNYLNTSGAQKIMQDWIDKNISVNTDTSMSSYQIQSMASNLMAGYQTYAQKNGYADLNNFQDSFTSYMSSDSARLLLTSSVMSMIDMSGLESSLSTIFQSYMTSVMSSYSDTMVSALSSQVSSATSQMMSQVMAQVSSQVASSMESIMNDMVSTISEAISDAMSDSMEFDEDAFMDAFEFNMDTDDLTELIISMSTSTTATYSGNLSGFGYVDFDTPGEISIYPIDFPSKDYVVDILDDYNQRMIDEGTPEKAITYTDTVGALMSSVTDIVNMISYVLIAFVAISLVVSSIMIGVITYISVLERQKEIGILRSIGASKGNISEVFNAETGIVGLFAGLLGVGLAWLMTIPGDAIIYHFAGTDQVKMVLMPQYAALLVVLSMLLTLIGGLIPSRKAAKSDPVIALRTE